MKNSQNLLKQYFKENYFVQSNIDSFDSLVDWRFQKIIDDQKEAVPSVIPPDVEEVRFKFGKLSIGKPTITEADGSERELKPNEARLRNLTYAAPVFLEVELWIDGKERERDIVKIADLPIMIKSKTCPLHKKSDSELIEIGEDPNDPGGYFIIDGTERYLVLLEDLAPNTIFAKKETSGPMTHSARIFSINESFKLPILVERSKEGIYSISFSTMKRVPLVVVMKALGLLKDKEIIEECRMGLNEDLYINLLEYKDIKNQEDAMESIAKSLHINLPKDRKLQRVAYMLDSLLLPHLGSKESNRLEKAKFLGRIVSKVNLLKEGKIEEDDKDHYMNKRIRMAGDLLEDLIRTNFNSLISDMLYIFERGVRRGKLTPLSSAVRTKLMTSRIRSAMATGKWTANRQGVCQRLERDNPINTFSSLQRVVSLLESNRESFNARELHPTHWGRLCPLESPEGKSIGLRKNLSLLAAITSQIKPEEEQKILKKIKSFDIEDTNILERTDVWFNGKIIGQTKNAKKLVSSIIDERRAGRISNIVNIMFNEDENKVEITSDRNRARRPLIVVKNGKPLLTEEHIEKIKKNELTWKKLVEDGIIEYVDALEEENLLIALNESYLSKDHTHIEIDPVAIFGITASLVPYLNFSQSSRIMRGQKLQKQGAGCYAANYLNRLDTNANLLHYIQEPIVKSFTHNLFGEDIVGGNNIVIAILSYEGYNMEDAIAFNRAGFDRGLFRSTHYRPYSAEKLRYPGAQMDKIAIPDKEVQGYTFEDDYRFLEDDGIIYPEVYVNSGDVLIGKTSPPRFLSRLESFSSAANIRKDTSVRVKFGEQGNVTKVFLTESESGNQLVRVEVRDTRVPELGDKFSSRHGQKGVIGKIVNPEDVPFTATGIQPDIIFSPFGMSRITVGHLIEALGGKLGALAGRFIDGTAFSGEKSELLRKELLKLGFREDGMETLYDGKSGKKYQAKVFMGNIFYMRLKYQVADKIQSRGRGRVALLTRQPTAGKAMEGGLRFGEMEKDTLVGHGASLLLKERFDSDKTITYICKKCGDIAMYDHYKKKTSCLTCGDKSSVYPVEMSYAFKVFLFELKSMGINPKLILKDRYEI